MDIRVRSLEKKMGEIKGQALDFTKVVYGVKFLKGRHAHPKPAYYKTPEVGDLQSVDLLKTVTDAALPPGLLPLHFIHRCIKEFVEKVRPHFSLLSLYRWLRRKSLDVTPLCPPVDCQRSTSWRFLLKSRHPCVVSELRSSYNSS